MKFRIREAREKVGMTQAQLAQMLGLNDVTLSGYELGKHDPKSNTLARIAQICGTSVDYLLGLEDEPPHVEIVKKKQTDEEELISIYQSLNLEGKRSLMKQARMHAQDPDFMKDTSSAVG